MAYEEQMPGAGMGGGPETMDEGMPPADMPPEAAPAEEGAGQKTITVSAADMPKGIDLKNGSKVTFCITSDPDESGKITGYFEGGESSESGESWEDDFRKEMSPRNPTETPQ